jgi:peptide deformylase
MALLNVLHFPDARLRTKAKPVQQVNDNIRQIIKDMFETMYAAPGIGLAATQVNIHQQIIVIDVSYDKDQPLCLINPKILSREGDICLEEGCLSVPGVYEEVERANQITIQALDQQGKSFTAIAEELLAVCIQHEMDHLQGRLFVDYLSNLKRERIRKKLSKQQSQTL